MSSREEVSYPILLKHDVDYILVIFGGLLGYSGDDMNKVSSIDFLNLQLVPLDGPNRRRSLAK
jgi:hypothetical protein